MSISEKLKKIAKQLEESSDDILAAAEANPEAFGVIASGIAESVIALEKTAQDIEEDSMQALVSEDDLEEAAAVAQMLDDYDLTRQADAIGNLISAYALQKEAQARTLEQINKMRAEEHSKRLDDYYKGPKERLDKQNKVEAVRKAVSSQVKRFEPLEAPLSTRYCPDMPGVQLIRISDSIYQCPYTGKMYDYKGGYTTDKGNKIPGGSVENQTTDLGDQQYGHTIFNSRESITQRYAESNPEIKKEAGSVDKTEK